MNATIDYNFVQKNHWRNRIWNILANRVKVHPRDAVVVYLPADNDFDRETAVKKGFHDDNLIAVDRDRKVVEQIRSRGHLCYHGTLHEMLSCWPEEVKVHAIVADFQCGLQPSLAGEFCAYQFARPFRDTVFCVNLLRGHDAESNHVRKWFSAKLGRPDLKDRSTYFIYHMNHTLTLTLTAFNNVREGCGARSLIDVEYALYKDSDSRLLWLLNKRLEALVEGVVTGSYRNEAKHSTMDWSVWSNVFSEDHELIEILLGGYNSHGLRNAQAFSFFASIGDAIMTNLLPGAGEYPRFLYHPCGVEPTYTNTVRKIAALLAHRTRRMS